MIASKVLMIPEVNDRKKLDIQLKNFKQAKRIKV